VNTRATYWAIGVWSLAFAGSVRAQDTLFVRDTNVAVPMRDGVVLRADVWRPADAARHPTLVYRTPYGKHQANAAFATARKAVARGYAVVMQDVRGRYASGGEYVAYQQEGRDGFDTIEWAATQPWSNGAVGTFGLSYPGAAQWLAALENPPHLKAMAPAMTFASPTQFWYSGGVWDNSWIGWIYNNIAPDRRRRLGQPPAPPWDSVKDRMRATRPLSAMKDLDAVAPWYSEWLRHPAYDPWWDWAELRGKYDRTNAAVLSFSAWYDEAYGPHGAITNYAGVVAARPLDSRAMLVMGPWSHGVPRAGRTSVGERPYGADGWIDYDELVLNWMDRYVKEEPYPGDSLTTRPVRIFVLGSDRWITADRWPIPGTRTDTIVFKPFADQTLIVSDPAQPIVNPFADRVGAHDYRALAHRRGVVTLETPALRSDLTVIGAMRAELAVSVDAPDADLWVKVYDVAPDGTAYNLMSPGLDVLRLSYRDGKPERTLLERGRIYRVHLGDLFTANTFKRGHRIRVVVTPSFVPDFSANLHTGELETASAEARTARITIYHDDLRPFRLILPVLPASAMLSPR
jgi:uncharacterized protein